MKDNLKSVETGQARWIVLAVALVFVPLCVAVVSQVNGNTKESSKGFLEKPDPRYEDCVREAGYMRFHHWELLRAVREEVVRYGKRSEVSLRGCSECHTSRESFCDRCHGAASVSPDCFSCHYYP